MSGTELFDGSRWQQYSEGQEADGTWRSGLTIFQGINPGSMETLIETALGLAIRPGTNVIDETRGQRVVVGSAGETLKQEALRQERPVEQPAASMPLWQLILIAVNVVLVLGAIWLFLARKRRPK